MLGSVRVPRLLLAAAAAVAVLPLSACGAATASAPEARVVVRIQGSAEPADYEVHLAEAGGGYRSVHTMRSGETRAFRVPAGWMTVRIPGVCVVPTAASGTATVDVRPGSCTLD